MAKILCIDTSEKICSVALSVNGSYASGLKEETENSHASALTILIRNLLAQNNISFKELDAICVAAGPGSYTGLRIGTSTVKGMCWSLDKPMIAIDTLSCIKERGVSVYDNYDVVVPSIDARRNEVFMSIFENDIEIVSPRPYVLEENPLVNYQDKKCLILGSGADKFQSFIKPIDYIDTNIVPQAKYLCRLAHQKYLANQFEDVAYFEPLYFKAVHVVKSKKKIF